MHAGYRHGEERFESIITGSEGSMRLDYRTVSLWNGSTSGTVELERIHPHFEMWKDFIHAIETGEQTLTSGEYGREVIAVCEAALKSGEGGREIRMASD